LWIDEVCDRFEDAWQAAGPAGPPPRVEDFLEETPSPERPELLRELLTLDLAYRRDRGQPVDAADYHGRFPDNADLVTGVFTDEPPRLRAPQSSHPSTVEMPNTIGHEAPTAPGGDAASWPRVPGFEILELLRAGGMGVVYRARQHHPHRVVALKLIRAGQLASPAEVERFRAEADIAACLDHDHIVPIYEVGEHAGQHYFSMKLMEGGSLAQRLGDFGLPPGDAAGSSRAKALVCQRQIARLMATVARAVHHAHLRGLLHRDMKPGNILLDVHGQAHVTDFGLAKRVSGATDVTLSGEVAGTPSYMAPEQASGQKGRLTTAVDVYGLGACLYELLTGRPPFQAATHFDTMLQVLDKDPERPRKGNPHIAPDLETICLTCLAKKPGRRYKSAEKLAEDLENWLAGRPIRARRCGMWERALKWARRRPAAAALVAVSAASVLSLLVLFAALWRNAEDRAAAVQQLDAAQTRIAESQTKLVGLERDVQQQQKTVEEKRAEVKQLEQVISQETDKVREAKLTTRRALYIRDLQLAQTALEGGQISRLAMLLEKHVPPPNEPDLRGFEWHYLWHTCHHELLLLAGHRGTVASGAFAPDCKTLITANDGGVWVWDMTTGKGRMVALGDNSSLGATAVAPDGDTLATATKAGVVHLWDLDNGTLKDRFQAHQGAIEILAFGPGGRFLATGGADQTARVWDLTAPKEPPLVLRGHRGAIHGLIFSPDGKYLATTSSDQTAKIWDLATGVEKADFKGQAGAWVTRVAFAPDGQTWATAEGHPFHSLLAARVQLWDARTKQVRNSWDVTGGGAFGLSFNPDGRYLAVGGNNGTVLLYDVASRSDVGAPKLYRAFRGHANRIFLLAFSPGGKLLATAGNDATVRVWDLAAAPPAVILRGHKASISSVAFAPDGKSVASASGDGVRLWDPRTSRTRSVFQGPSGGGGPLAFSPDSKRLVTGVDGRTLRLWDIAAGEQVVLFQGHTGRVTCAAFAPDGKTLATSAHDHTVRLWDVATGAQRAVLQHDEVQVWSVAFTPDGQTLISSTEDGQAILWDPSTGERRGILPSGDRGALSVAVSPDGRSVAVSHFVGLVRLWDIASQTELVTFKGHTDHILHVAFTPDGKALVTASEDGTLKFWDLATSQELLTLRGSPAATLSFAAFSRDGKMLAAGGGDGILHFWSASLDAADRSPLASAISPERIYAWHLGEAVSSLQQGQRGPALFHVNRLLKGPLPVEVLAAEPGFQNELAVSHALLGQLLDKATFREQSERVWRRAIDILSKLREASPDRPEYRQHLGAALDTLGTLLWKAKRLPEAEQIHRQALQVRQELVDEFAAHPDYRWALGGSLNNLALVLRDQGNFPEAIGLLEKAVSCQQEALQSRPKHPPYRQYLLTHLRVLGDTLVQAGDHGKAAEVAAQMPRLLPDGWQAPHFAARIFAQCATSAEKDSRLPVDSRKELAADYAERALDQLGAAVGKGFSDAAGLQKDPAFAPLREREGFQKLLRTLEKKKGNAGK
jgi:WD40 repeat protein